MQTDGTSRIKKVVSGIGSSVIGVGLLLLGLLLVAVLLRQHRVGVG